MLGFSAHSSSQRSAGNVASSGPAPAPIQAVPFRPKNPLLFVAPPSGDSPVTCTIPFASGWLLIAHHNGLDLRSASFSTASYYKFLQQVSPA